MFETTAHLLQRSPLAIVPLLALVWFVGKGLIQRTGIVYSILRRVLTVAVTPLIFLFVFAELTGIGALSGLARSLFDLEAGVVNEGLAIVDSLVAALLRAFLGFVDGFLNAAVGSTPAVSPWDPLSVVSTAAFLVAVFGIHFLAGGVLVWFTAELEGDLSMDGWLSGAGLVLFVSGMVWLLLHLGTFDVGRLGREFAVLATSAGVTSGVVVTALVVKLDYEDSGDRPETGEPSRDDTDDHHRQSRYERLKRTIRTVSHRR